MKPTSATNQNRLLFAYRLTWKLYYFLKKTILTLLMAVKIVITAFWIGILRQKTVNAITQYFYDHDPLYFSKEHTCRGLWKWEEAVIDTYFSNCRTIFIPGAGAGRELIRLTEKGFEVDGCDCNEKMVKWGQEVLDKSQINSRLLLSKPNSITAPKHRYDGVIVGWGMYTHIKGRQNRTALLRDISKLVDKNAPLLLSFFAINPTQRSFRILYLLAAAFSSISGNEKPEVGEVLDPLFKKFFTEKEIREELAAAGFDCIHYNTEEYAYAVAIKNDK